MTDHHAAYLVTLEKDIREDDAEESILVALRMIKGVIRVRPVQADMHEQLARIRRDRAWVGELSNLIDRMDRQGP